MSTPPKPGIHLWLDPKERSLPRQPLSTPNYTSSHYSGLSEELRPISAPRGASPRLLFIMSSIVSFSQSLLVFSWVCFYGIVGHPTLPRYHLHPGRLPQVSRPDAIIHAQNVTVPRGLLLLCILLTSIPFPAVVPRSLLRHSWPDSVNGDRGPPGGLHLMFWRHHKRTTTQRRLEIAQSIR